MNTKTVSIILPCYNEAEHLESSLKILDEHSKDFKFKFEFVFVEDKSTDNTREVLKKLEPHLKDHQFIYHDKNMGRGAAVKSGFKAAKGDLIGFIDIDLEVSPRYINSFIESLAQNDAAIANRRYYSKTFWRALIRNFLSNYYRMLNKRILKHSYKDTEAGYKFFRRESVERFFKKETNDHWFWDTEFMMFCFRYDLKVAEIEVEFLRDDRKASTVNVFTDSLHYIKELIKYKRKYKAGEKTVITP
jgi:glycosyltransferase involved in cell wall biosynthesis